MLEGRDLFVFLPSYFCWPFSYHYPISIWPSLSLDKREENLIGGTDFLFDPAEEEEDIDLNFDSKDLG